MNSKTKYYNSTFLYFIICLVGVLFPLVSLSKNNSALSIEKLQRMKSFIIDDLAITIPISVRFGDKGFNFPDLMDATQMELDYELRNTVNTSWRFKLINELARNWTSSDDGQYILELTHSDDNFVIVEPNTCKAQVHYSQASVHANDLPFFITQATLEHLMSAEIELLGLLKSPDKALDSPFIDARIIIIGLKSRHYADIFEENLTPLNSFAKEVLDISNVTVTVTALESLTEDDSIINAPSSLYYFYSDIHNEALISNKTNYPNRISYIYNDSVTNDDAVNFISRITDDLKGFMGLPKNPTDNLAIKVLVMKRYLTLKAIIESIDHLTAATLGDKNSFSGQIEKFISNLNPIIDCLHKNESKHDWNNLLAWSRYFKESSSQLLQDSHLPI
ncbi:unnamed protein product [Debaryomyces tyrocola]|nr:unnamed protein product [Debaryomyces tyrocola]